MPLYFWAESEKSGTEYYAENDKALKKIGAEKFEELWSKSPATLRKYEIKSSRPLPTSPIGPNIRTPASFG
jgi:hypothetical protein